MTATRERILQAAEAVLVRKGVDGARTREIASAARVNQALIHYYFGTKEELGRLVVRRVVRRSVVPILGSWSAGDPLDVNVRRVVEGCTEEFRDRPEVPGFLLSALHREPGLAGAALDAIGASGKGSPQLLTTLLALCLFPFVARPALQMALGVGDDGFDRFLDRHADQVTAFVLRGLDHDPPGGPAGAGR